MNRTTGQVERKLELERGVTVDVNPTGNRWLFLSAPRTLELIDVDNWQRAAKLQLDEAAKIARFGPEGRRVYVGLDSGTVRALDAMTLEERASSSTLGAVHQMDFSLTRRWVAVVTADSPRVEVLDLENLEPVATVEVASNVYDACFLPDGDGC